MPCLSVIIVRFVDETFPGFVECTFIDANQRVHTLVDKVPTFSALTLWSDSQYPQPGAACCRILESAHDESGRGLLRITIDGVETVDGETEFVVEKSQITEDSSR
jgi:hypothetical protein